MDTAKPVETEGKRHVSLIRSMKFDLDTNLGKYLHLACQNYKDKLHKEAAEKNKDKEQHERKEICNFDYEVIVGFENIRLNLYSATDRDVWEVSSLFTIIRQNPGML